MKILMVTDKMELGGAETHILTLIRELALSGDDITLLSGGGAFADDLGRRGIRVVYSPFDKRAPLSILRCKRTLAEEMRKCDVVHTHTRFSSFLAKAVRGKRSFPPIVATAHLNFKLFPFGRLAFWGDRTIAVSEDIKQYLTDNYSIDSENITLTKNSVDINNYSSERLPKKLIIHTSRIDRGRSRTAFLLCETAKTLLQKYPDWRILIVGDGTLFSALKRAAREANSALGFDGVILTGARYDIPSILRYGAIFVGVSRSALEGMAAGLPIIISGDEGYGGIATYENYSLLLKTNFCARGLERATSEKLTGDIEILINDHKKAQELSAFSKDLIRRAFTSAEMAKDAKECYKCAQRALNVCLLGYFGYSNLGDETILREAIKALFTHSISRINVLSANGTVSKTVRNSTQGFDGIKLYDRFSPSDIKAAIDSSDILILCGGNLLQNETSERSLIYYSQIMSYARRRGLRIYILSSGFGDVSGALGRYLLRRSIGLSDFCGCRTDYDLELAKKYCSNSKFMPDFCFLLNEAYSDSAKTQFSWIVSKNGLIQVDEILDISKKRGLEPLAILLNYDEDKDICKNLSQSKIEYYIPESFEGFCRAVGKSAFAVSERLHGAIFSILCHTPVYLTADSGKKRALIADSARITCGAAVVLPYTRSGVCEKKEIGVRDSDFNYLISNQRHNINYALSKLFD